MIKVRVVTINVNGIRSAYKKGLFTWLSSLDADIICLQEVRADFVDIPAELINWRGYYHEFYPAMKKGYSGVAIYAKHKPCSIVRGIGDVDIDNEGRYLQFDYKDFSVVSIYLPSGASGSDKQLNKFKFMQLYKDILATNISSNRQYIICGDWNIAHREIDLKNWRSNTKNSGFLPEERQWLTDLINSGYVDTWRKLYPEIAGYTWWSNRGQAYANDVGWRIDYQVCTQGIGDLARNALIYKDIKFSDHAPLVVDYAIEIAL